MTNPRVQPAAELSADALRRYLVETAQRELDGLRAALDARLAALEAALAHPNSQASLEDLVLELARVATAEAEAAAARASLETQLHAQERALVVGSEAQRALEAERAIISALRLELEQAQATIKTEREATARLQREIGELRPVLEAERKAAVTRDRELEEARGVLLTEREARVALQNDVEKSQAALQNMRAGTSALDAELAQQREKRNQLSEALAAAQREVAEAHRTVESRAAAADAHQSATEKLERRCAELDQARAAAVARVETIEAERAEAERARKDAEARAEEATAERDSLADDLARARQAVVAMQAAVDARLEAIDAKRAHTIRAWEEAETRAEDAIRERNALTAELDAARQAAIAAQAAVDSSREATDAGRAEMERAWKDAESRAEEAMRERDALASELDVARQTAVAAQPVEARLDALEAERTQMEVAWKAAEARADQAITAHEALTAELDAARQDAKSTAQYEQRLEAAAEKIRTLELQLFERERGPQDLDVDLASLLEAPAATPESAVRRATRHRFPSTTEVHIDGDVGVLVDLSIGGAQVLCRKKMEVSRVATVSLPSNEVPVSCQGRIVWAWLEPHSKGRPLRYRAGILFTAVDEAAVQAFIARYGSS